MVWQGMTGGAKAHYDGILAFSQTDFTEDLRQISIPMLVMQGDDDLHLCTGWSSTRSFGMNRGLRAPSMRDRGQR